MTVLINASNTSGLTFTSDTSGNVAIQSNGTTVATISGTGANAGIQMGAAFAPTFSVYRTGNQSIGSASWTKIQLNTEEFDTANCFDSTTNYRFTPTVSGYYQFSFCVTCAAFSGSYALAEIYKNGSEAKKGSNFSPNASAGPSSSGSALIYMNGSTDYVELFFISSAASTVNGTGVYDTFFQGFLARSA